MLSSALIVRMDAMGDVLLTGPLVRAVAASSSAVTFLAGPDGVAAAELLVGAGAVVVGRAAWIEASAPPVRRSEIEDLVDAVNQTRIDTAIIATSFHQSPLPMALLLRLAGVERIGAISIDYPGSLLDVRHHVDEDIHEVERGLSLATAMGYALPPGDDGRLRVDLGDARIPTRLGHGPYVVVHPGASVTARAWSPDLHAAVVSRLCDAGHHVVVTGGRHERELTRRVAGAGGSDVGGQLDLAGLGAVLAGAQAVVVGNTGPAHLAAAVGTPVVSLYAPTVPALRWHPWMVDHVLLGDQAIGCAGCRARVCPVAGHPCVDQIAVDAVVDALDLLLASAGVAPVTATVQ